MLNKKAKQYADDHSKDDNWISVYEAYKDGYEKGKEDFNHGWSDLLLFAMIGAAIFGIIFLVIAGYHPQVFFNK